MEFWAAEVKSGESFTVQPGVGWVIHLSQASLGESKKDTKGSENVLLSVNIEGKKLVLGTLNTDKLPQQQFDLVFDKDFELSHNLKSGSVYFFGYKATNPFEDEDDFEVDDSDESEESDEEIIPLTAANNGKAEVKGKEKVKIGEPEDTDEDEMSEDEEGDESNSDDDEDESDDSEEETPKKVAYKAETSKKRPAGSAAKTPVPEKKAKLTTPQKTDGKKGGVHVATPHPAKQAGKTPANKNQQTPKSGGTHHCKPCNRSFGSESALESHSKAKHSAGK